MVTHSANEPRWPIRHIKLDIYHYTFAGFKKVDLVIYFLCLWRVRVKTLTGREIGLDSRYYNAEKMLGFAIYVIEFHY